MERFKDKVVLVTGGTQGMGKVSANAFMKEGATVCISGRDEVKGQAVVDEIIKDNNGQGNIFFIKCDIAKKEDVEHMINWIENKFGRLDCAFNNAGVTAKYAAVGDVDEDNWMDVMNTNATGTFLSMKYEIRLMLKNGGGVILNNSSIAAVMVTPTHATYIASKFAIIGLTKSASIDYALKNIRVNAIAPGPISGGMNTEENLKANPERTEKKISLVAMNRFGTPEEVAETVLFLCSDKASYITGVVLPVDGGAQAGKWK